MTRMFNDIIKTIRTSKDIKFIPVEFDGIKSVAIAEVKHDAKGMTIEPLAILLNEELFPLVNPSPTTGDVPLHLEGVDKQ